MKTKLTLLANTAAAAFAFAAPAEAAGAWYVGVFGGGNWGSDHAFAVETAPTVSADTLVWDTEAETGFVVGGAVGLHLNQFMDGLRAEVEVAYRENSVDGVFASSVGTIPGIGTLEVDQSSFAVLANLWYDFNVGGITPYVGGGIGWAESQVEGNQVTIVTRPFDFSNSGFAWQLGAGINFDISPNVVLGLGYRYFEGPDVTVGSPTPFNDATSDVDNQNHSAILSLTFAM